MSATVPSTMRALVQGEKDQAPSVREINVPSLRPNDVLVKVHYAAQNPTDWKHSALFAKPGDLLGCDYSGHVAVVGSSPNNTSLSVGDYVAGCVHGGLHDDEGSFAEYVKVQSDLVQVLPRAWEARGQEAAQFGIGWWTALQTMIHCQGNPWPGEGKAPNSPWYLIYGASSSVGLFALQLAKIMGFRPLAVCSARNFGLVRSYGAEAAIDYHDKDCSAQITRLTGGGVELAFDTVSEEGSIAICLAGFKRGNGRLDCLLPISDDSKALAGKAGVKIDSALMYCLHGKDTYFGSGWVFEQKAADRAFGVQVCKRSPGIIERYGIRANPADVRGGLEAITDGFEYQKEGKVSGVKLVYKIAQ